MDKKETTCDVPKIRPRSEQVEAIFALFAIRQQLEKAEKVMGKRIKSIPHGTRDIRMIESVAAKLSANLISTIPDEKIPSMRENARYMTYSVHFNRFQPIARPANWAIMETDAVDVIIKRAKDLNCFGCDRDCGKCDFGRALDKIMIHTREKGQSWELIDLTKDMEGIEDD